MIGTVTTVRHTLGKSGFYTEFTVDSGGRKGRPQVPSWDEIVFRARTDD